MFTDDKTTAWSHELLCHFNAGDIVTTIVYPDDGIGIEADTYLILDTVRSDILRGNPMLYELLNLNDGVVYNRMYLTPYNCIKVA